VAPRLERDVSPRLAEHLVEDLAERHPSVEWCPELVVDRLVEAPAPVTELLAVARRRLLQGDWHLAVVTSDIWRISTALSWPRLGVISVVSVAMTITAVIVVPGLWERAPDPRASSQVVLFNLATVATVTVGIVSLYVVLFLLILGGAALVAVPDTFSAAVDQDVGVTDYLTLAWFVASLATIGGGLGSALDSEDVIREAAYASAAAEQPDAGARPAARP
jgi:hypothetical protein